MDMTKVSHPRSNLRIARAWSGLTVERIIEAADCSRASYYRYEKGEQPIPLEQAELLAELFGVSREWLVGWRPTSEEFAELEAKGAA